MPQNSTILDKLASSLGRRDEISNQELAQEIITQNDIKAIEELIENSAIKTKTFKATALKFCMKLERPNQR